MLHNYVLVAAAVVMMARATDFKFKRHPCRVCGQRGEHLVGCPGRDR